MSVQTGMREELAATAAAFFAEQAPLHGLRKHLETGPGYDLAVWRRYCDDLGGGRLLLPAEHGGLDAGIEEASLVAEAAGRVLYSGPYLPQWLAGLLLCRSEATGPEGVSTLLEDIAEGRLIPGLLLDASRVQAAVGAGGCWVLEADPSPVELAERVGVFLVLARTHEGEGLFLVEGGTEGVHLEEVENFDLTRRTGLVRMRAVAARRLDGVRDDPAQRVAHVRMLGTVLRAAENLGSLRRLHALTTEYAGLREQFGRTIGSFQAVKHNLADLLVDVEAATATVAEAVRAVEEARCLPQGARARESAELAALTAGLVVEDAFARMAHDAIQLHGGIGFTWDHDAHLFYRRAASARGLAGARSMRLDRFLDLASAEVAAESDASAPAPAESAELAAFRSRARAWLLDALADREAPEVRPGPPSTTLEGLVAGKRYQRALHRAGFSGITYPLQHGGAGLSREFEDAFLEETRATGAGEDKVFGIGISMIGPAILQLGSDEQRSRYLPPLLRGDEIWCELFSEPGSGSDMAGARTRAVADGDDFVITGQKVWTSNGHLCDFGLLLARTDPDAAKHAGLSMFVLPMGAEGVEVRPLRQITGATDFNEVFLDEVRVPRSALLGGLGQGWRVAREVLQHERLAMGATAVRRVSASDLLRLAAHAAPTGDPVARAGLAEQLLRERRLRAYFEHLSGSRHRHRPPPESGAVAKLLMTSTMQGAATLALQLLGEGASAWVRGTEPGDLLQRVLSAQAFSIAGGTDNILRNLIGERALGLPRDAVANGDSGVGAR